MDFTPEQQAAIRHKDGPLLIVAGPGSGKTAVLTHRIAWMIEKHRIPPEQILVITFTRAAAQEMRQRFMALIQEPAVGEKVTIRTFHAIFYEILRRELGKPIPLLEEGTAVSWIVAWLQEKTGCGAEEADFEAERILTAASRLKNTGFLDAPDEKKDLYREAFQYYEEQKQLYGTIDFDDMMVRLEQVFRDDPRVLRRCQEQFRYLLVDEYQDTNGLQERLLLQLAEQTQNICVVGDDDQSIYQFRGAVPGVLLAFPHRFPAAERIDLTVNFRCGTQIVRAASRLIARNQERYEKALRTPGFVRSEIIGEAHAVPAGQAAWIARMIEKERKHEPLREIAVLCRTRSQFPTIRKALRFREIPYQTAEMRPTASAMERDLQAFVRLVLDPEDQEARMRIWNRPGRGIPEAFAQPHSRSPAIRIRLEEMDYHFRKIACMTPEKAVRYIWKTVGYRRYMQQEQERHYLRWQEVLDAYRSILERSRAFPSLQAWIAKERTEQEEGVHLITMHEAKGLEFDVVFIPDMNEGTMPHERSGPKDLEEERRIVYVAMTRARKKLYLSYVKEQSSKKKPSRFLYEI